MARSDPKMHHIERALMTSLVVLFFVDNVMTMLESTHLTFHSLVRDGLTCDALCRIAEISQRPWASLRRAGADLGVQFEEASQFAPTVY